MSYWVQIIASNLCMAVLIGGLAWLVGRNCRRATLAHRLWLLVFIKLITPPLVTIPLPIPEAWWFDEAVLKAGDSNQADMLLLTDGQRSGEVRSSQLVSEIPLGRPGRFVWLSRLSWGHVILCVWVIGFLWVVARGTTKLIRFYRLIRRHGVVDHEATLFVQQLLQSAGDSYGERYRPQVLRVPIRVSPMLCGFLTQAYIVCPDSLWNSLGRQEREAFLAHEAAHYHRGDHWVRWLEWSVAAIYWWFPGVYFARRQLERHEEACCDGWAIRMLAASPRQYAEALLQVVDFISEHQVGMVRLTSGMHPTYTLEERLHLIMKGGPAVDQTRMTRVAVSLGCVTLCGLHPIVRPYQTLPVDVTEHNASRPWDDPAQVQDSRSLVSLSEGKQSLDLPPEPEGFWNLTPQRRWADVSLTLPGTRLVADAREGMRFLIPDGRTLRFEPHQLSAVAEVTATKRVIIGDEEGQIRLWDLAAGMPVSLIGTHPSAVTSLAFHEWSGVISGDRGGSVLRWDIQSGQVLATWAESSLPVQSVRFSRDGRTLAILSGQWDTPSATQKLFLVDSRSLQTIEVLSMASATAIVAPSPGVDWVAIDWSGNVIDLRTGLPLVHIPKHDVSAIVLCQDSAWWPTLREQGP